MRNENLRIVSSGARALSISLIFIAFARADAEVALEGRDPLLTGVETAHAAYHAKLAEQNAAAERAKLAQPLAVVILGRANDPNAPREVVVQSPCEEGEVVWHYDASTDLCAGLCQTSDDCLADERCVGLDLGLSPDGQTVPFENVEMPDGRVALGLCDPFWQTNPNVVADEVAQP